MTTKSIRAKYLPLGVSSAVALAIAVSLGMSGGVAAKPAPDKAAAAAQAALARGNAEQAVKLGEALVAANPREGSYRALLAQAYLKAGRFESAAATFDDAMKLGDNSAKTALGLSLAYVGAGRNRDAVAILEDWRDAIPVADLGLALALAGETTRGSALLTDAVRGGENTPKLRQNLAYAYALDGRWREARIMMSQDVPANAIDARLSDWASKARPEDARLRVADLIKAPLRTDPGQPAALALNPTPAAEQLAAEDTAAQAAPVASVAVAAPAAPVAEAAELPPVAPVTASESAALASYAPVTAPAATPVAAPVAVPAAAPAVASAAPAESMVERFVQNFISQPVVQAVPTVEARPARTTSAGRGVVAVAAQRRAGPVASGGTHLVQLGSFFTQQGARRAWGIYAAKNPQLRNYRMTITQAQVRGKTYFRVAAAGLNGSQGAWSLCSAVKARGGACFAYAASTGVPGTRAGAPMMAQARPAAKAPVKAASAAPAMARKR